jgi:hypothetical protein
MTPGADILDLEITKLDSGQVEIQKEALVHSYPTALYRVLKGYQATAQI